MSKNTIAIFNNTKDIIFILNKKKKIEVRMFVVLYMIIYLNYFILNQILFHAKSVLELKNN